MTLVVACTVTRTELSLGTLNLNDGSTYEIVRAGPGARRRRRKTVSSDWVHGELVVADPLTAGERRLRVRCKANNGTGLATAISAVVAAFSQGTYTVSGTFDTGFPFEWVNCTAADIEPGEGEEWEKFSLHSHQQEIALSIPSSPVSASGPF